MTFDAAPSAWIVEWKRIDWAACAGTAAVAVGFAAISARNGGYFPTAWGWSVLILAWCALLAVVLRRNLIIDGFSLTLLGSIVALAGWIGISAVWSIAPDVSVQEGERAVVYATAVTALVLVGDRLGATVLCAGMVLGVTSVCAYALATRLFPGRIGSYDPFATYRLSAPIGYWNGLGLAAVLASLLAIGFAGRASTLRGRGLASASLVVLVLTLYFTFSRGSWLAFVIGIAFLLAIDPRRIHTCITLLVAGLAPSIAVVLASRQAALTTQGANATLATMQGHQVAALVGVLLALAALLAMGFAVVERKWKPAPEARKAFATALVVALLSAGGTAIAHWGSPWRMANRAWSGFTAGPLAVDGNLNKRLFHLSNNGRIVSWKSALREWKHAPVAGTGAGTFETWWLRRRTTAFQIRDAHSLYLETLGELGLVGLLMLALVVVAPLVAGIRNRRHPLVPFAAASFLAWAVHAGVDWDWEIPAVTLLGLACGVVCCTGGVGTRWIGLGVKSRAAIGTLAAVCAIFGLVAGIGNQALASSRNALDSQNYAKAQIEAAKAARWAPWLAEPWVIQGDIQALNQSPSAARADFRKAIAKDPHGYLAWYSLAGVETGAARRAAAAKVVALNPLSDEAAEMRQILSRRP